MPHSNKTGRLSQLDLAVMRLVHYSKFPTLMHARKVQQRLSEEEDIDATLREVSAMLSHLEETNFLRSARIAAKQRNGSVVYFRIYRLSRFGELALARDDRRPIVPRKDAS